MFNLQAFSTQKSGVSDGSVANALNKIRSLLTKLLHSPETGVIELTSGEIAADIAKGKIVALDNEIYQCVRAYADDGPGQPFTCRGFAVCLSDLVEPGEKGFFRFAGEADTILEPALDPGAGESVYVSTTVYGSGTNVVPTGNNEWVRKVGYIKDASQYTAGPPANLFVRMVLDKCCENQIQA